MAREVKQGDLDDRQDKPTRDRMDELVASMDNYRKSLDKRYERVARRLYALVAIFVVVFAVSAMLYQGQRYTQTVDACNRTNKQTLANIALIRDDFGADGDTILKAQARLPHTPPLAHRIKNTLVPGPPPGYSGATTCEEYASERVKGPRL